MKGAREDGAVGCGEAFPEVVATVTGTSVCKLGCDTCCRFDSFLCTAVTGTEGRRPGNSGDMRVKVEKNRGSDNLQEKM